MFCHVNQRKYSEFSAVVEDVSIRKRLPLMGALELTYRCNLACRHCYCNLPASDSRKRDELTANEIKRLLDDISDAGCLWLLLTGGETLLREDFRGIYTHAVRRGMIIEVFTNATLIDDAAAGLFAEYPPIGVDISVYGSTPEIHDKVTGIHGSFKKTMDGIAMLRKHGVKFSMKTILMTLNYCDLDNIKKLAAGLGAKFHFDSLVSPRTDGGMAPAGFRLDMDKMVGLELDAEEDYKATTDVFKNYWNKTSKEALNCGAGVFAFNVNPYGALSPCTMFSSFQYPLRRMTFSDAWSKMVMEYGEKQNDLLPEECKSCSMLMMCTRCAAWAEAETGKCDGMVDYLCKYAKELENRYFNKHKGGTA